MEFYSKTLGPVNTNFFILFNKSIREAIIIDAPEGSWEISKSFIEYNNLTLKGILITHGHIDHIVDCYKFNEANIPIFAHYGDKILFENPKIMQNLINLPFKEKIKACKITKFFLGNKDIKFNIINNNILVRHVPGHSLGSVIYYIEKYKLAFVGDTLFYNNIGRYDLPGGDLNTLKNSINQKIYSLPKKTIFLPGHGPNYKICEDFSQIIYKL